MRDINALHPMLIEKVYELIELAEKNGITIGISECVRTVAEQDALYAQGRTAPGNKVTNCKGSTYSSMHQWGVAFDFYLKEDVDGDGKTSDDAFNNSTRLFEKVGALGQSIGLEWGGAWKSTIDRPHFQLPNWGSTASKLKSQYGTPENFMKTWERAAEEDKDDVTPETTVVSGKATITAKSGLIIRKAADKDSARITAIPYKKECEVLQLNAGKADGIVWAKVSYKGYTGYASQKYLNVTKEPSAETSTTTSATTPTVSENTYSKSVVDSARSKNASFAGTYTPTTDLNLRAGAGTHKDIITVMPKGSEVRNYGFYTEHNGTPWYLVAFGKYTGFCSVNLLKRN